MTTLNEDPRYTGRIIGFYERDYIDDSYEYMVYIDPETGKVADCEIGYVSNSFPGKVDITEENFKEFLRQADKRYIEGVIERDRMNAREITKGKYVEVVKGRKVPLHIKGTVFWAKEQDIRDRWGRLRDRVVRVGIKDAEGNVYWTYANNCVVINPEDYYTPVAELRRKVKEYKSEAYKRVVMSKQKVVDCPRDRDVYGLNSYRNGERFIIY